MDLKNSKEFDNFIQNWTTRFTQLATEIQPIINQISNDFKKFINEAPECLFELAKHGWYVDTNFTTGQILELSNLLKNGKASDVNNYLSLYYTNDLDFIEKRLLINYPLRKKIFHEAFRNHSAKSYYSSITLLLTQVDGICFDITKNFFFKNNQKLAKSKIYRPGFEEIIKIHSSEFSHLLMSPINEPNVINDNWDNVENWPTRFNRHEIIHGIDFNYGNELNSLKIISLINYIDSLLYKLDNPLKI